MIAITAITTITEITIITGIILCYSALYNNTIYYSILLRVTESFLSLGTSLRMYVYYKSKHTRKIL